MWLNWFPMLTITQYRDDYIFIIVIITWMWPGTRRNATQAPAGPATRPRPRARGCTGPSVHIVTAQSQGRGGQAPARRQSSTPASCPCMWTLVAAQFGHNLRSSFSPALVLWCWRVVYGRTGSARGHMPSKQGSVWSHYSRVRIKI